MSKHCNSYDYPCLARAELGAKTILQLFFFLTKIGIWVLDYLYG